MEAIKVSEQTARYYNLYKEVETLYMHISEAVMNNESTMEQDFDPAMHQLMNMIERYVTRSVIEHMSSLGPREI